MRSLWGVFLVVGLCTPSADSRVWLCFSTAPEVGKIAGVVLEASGPSQINFKRHVDLVDGSEIEIRSDGSVRIVEQRVAQVFRELVIRRTDNAIQLSYLWIADGGTVTVAETIPCSPK